MKSKLQQIRELYAAGDEIGALRIAAKFGQLGDEKEPITRAWSAHASPQFYRDIGKNPEDLIRAGIEAMVEKYNLPRPATRGAARSRPQPEFDAD